MPLIDSFAKQGPWYVSRYECPCGEDYFAFEVPSALAGDDVFFDEGAVPDKMWPSAEVAIGVALAGWRCDPASATHSHCFDDCLF